MPEPLTFRDQAAEALVAAPHASSFRWEWFDPAWWGHCARPVDDGGRGSAWFIDAEPGMVLRRYQRGGAVARVSRSSYLYMGWRRVRSVAEFQVLMRALELGLPVPQPIAASVWWKGVLSYQASLLTERLQGVQSLGQLVGTLKWSRWQAVGRTIRRFHEAGICHADLNCFNVLLSGDSVYLIDFDKGAFRDPAAKGWRNRNLKRLHRSLNKVVWPEHGQPGPEQAWKALLEGYLESTETGMEGSR